MWIARPVLALAFAVSLAACGGKSKPPQDPPDDPPDTMDVSQLGAPCTADGQCPNGMSCAKYFGIAGPSGPEFSSCEVACPEGSPCPTGTECVTIADGPGAVCRPPAVAEPDPEPDQAN